MKNYKKEYKSRFNDYSKENVDEKEKLINENSSKLPIHQLLRQIKCDQLLWDSDAVRLCPSAMWDEKSFYLRIETGYAFIVDMNDELVEKFNTQFCNQGSAILKIKYYNPLNLIVQHIPIKKSKKMKVKDENIVI